jgi:chlorobactene glucosyltransferase
MRLVYLLSAVILPLAWLAERHYRRLPTLPAVPPNRPLPELAIIIPARNEAANLRRLLPSLQALDYPGPLEIIVVDDGSTDETAAIAQAHGARLIRLDGPPSGWFGKPHACQQGAEAAYAEWLLFTDADTWHEPAGPAQAVAYAQATGLDGLSLFLRQESHGLLDRLALCSAHATYFAGLAEPAGVLNGQYILLRRDPFFATGGFTPVRQQLTEDLALGRHLLEQGCHVPVLHGQTAARVYMYRDTLSLWRGLSRFAVTSLRWTGRSSVWTILYTILLAAPAELLLASLLWRRWFKETAAAWLLAVVALWPWARRFGNGRDALLAPFGAIQIQLVAAYGLLRRALGRKILWKERLV